MTSSKSSVASSSVAATLSAATATSSSTSSSRTRRSKRQDKFIISLNRKKVFYDNETVNGFITYHSTKLKHYNFVTASLVCRVKLFNDFRIVSCAHIFKKSQTLATNYDFTPGLHHFEFSHILPEGFPATCRRQNDIHVDWMLRVKVYTTGKEGELVSNVLSRIYFRKGTLYAQNPGMTPRTQVSKTSILDKKGVFQMECSLSKDVYHRAEPIYINCKMMNDSVLKLKSIRMRCIQRTEHHKNRFNSGKRQMVVDNIESAYNLPSKGANFLSFTIIPRVQQSKGYQPVCIPSDLLKEEVVDDDEIPLNFSNNVLPGADGEDGGVDQEDEEDDDDDDEEEDDDMDIEETETENGRNRVDIENNVDLTRHQERMSMASLAEDEDGTESFTNNDSVLSSSLHRTEVTDQPKECLTAVTEKKEVKEKQPKTDVVEDKEQVRAEMVASNKNDRLAVKEKEGSRQTQTDGTKDKGLDDCMNSKNSKLVGVSEECRSANNNNNDKDDVDNDKRRRMKGLLGNQQLFMTEIPSDSDDHFDPLGTADSMSSLVEEDKPARRSHSLEHHGQISIHNFRREYSKDPDISDEVKSLLMDLKMPNHSNVYSMHNSSSSSNGNNSNGNDTNTNTFDACEPTTLSEDNDHNDIYSHSTTTNKHKIDDKEEKADDIQGSKGDTAASAGAEESASPISLKTSHHVSRSHTPKQTSSSQTTNKGKGEPKDDSSGIISSTKNLQSDDKHGTKFGDKNKNRSVSSINEQHGERQRRNRHSNSDSDSATTTTTTAGTRRKSSYHSDSNSNNNSSDISKKKPNNRERSRSASSHSSHTLDTNDLSTPTNNKKHNNNNNNNNNNNGNSNRQRSNSGTNHRHQSSSTSPPTSPSLSSSRVRRQRSNSNNNSANNSPTRRHGTNSNSHSNNSHTSTNSSSSSSKSREYVSSGSPLQHTHINRPRSLSTNMLPSHPNGSAFYASSLSGTSSSNNHHHSSSVSSQSSDTRRPGGLEPCYSLEELELRKSNRKRVVSGSLFRDMVDLQLENPKTALCLSPTTHFEDDDFSLSISYFVEVKLRIKNGSDITTTLPFILSDEPDENLQTASAAADVTLAANTYNYNFHDENDVLFYVTSTPSYSAPPDYLSLCKQSLESFTLGSIKNNNRAITGEVVADSEMLNESLGGISNESEGGITGSLDGIEPEDLSSLPSYEELGLHESTSVP